MKTINDMILASEHCSAAKEADTGENATGRTRTTLTDLYKDGLLKDGQQLVYTRNRLNTPARIVIGPPGKAFIQIDGVADPFATPSGAAKYILEGKSCQGWDFFRLSNGGGKGVKLGDVREEFRGKQSKNEPPVSRDVADYVDSVFGKYGSTFGRIERIVREIGEYDEFRLPSRYLAGSQNSYDYSILLDVLPDKDGVVRGYFREDEDNIYDIDLNESPLITINGEGCSGLQATRLKAKATRFENESNSYQWSVYWYIAEGKHRGKRFVDVYREVLAER